MIVDAARPPADWRFMQDPLALVVLEHARPHCFGDGRAVVHLPNASMQQANALRRALVERVETLAIDACAILANTSAQHDDAIAHRLGLVPLAQTADAGPLVYSLNARAPPDRPLRVCSGHLECVGHSAAPAYGGVEIVKLYPGEHIHLIAVAQRAAGDVHAKFCAAHAFHRPSPHGGAELVVESRDTRDALDLVRAALALVQ